MQKLKNLRKYHNLNRDKMAELLGVSMYTYRNWEHDANKMPTEMLIKVSNTFNIPIKDLIDDDMPNNTELVELILKIKEEIKQELKEELRKELIKEMNELNKSEINKSVHSQLEMNLDNNTITLKRV